MNEKEKCRIWARACRTLKTLLAGLVLYLDDLLLIGGGCCFVTAAWEYAGRPAGLAVSGICMCSLALVIARSRRGGDG